MNSRQLSLVDQKLTHVQVFPESTETDGSLDEDVELLSWDQLPRWLQNNDCVRTAYLPPNISISDCLASALTLHNETVHIWTHALGADAWLILLAYFLYTPHPYATTADIIAVAIFFASVAVCFTLSTVHHTLLNHSPLFFDLTEQLDHLGIVLVIWGSTVASNYFNFYAYPDQQRQYILIATGLAAASVYATFQPLFRSATGRAVHFCLYTALGLSAMVPAAHATVLHGWEAQKERAGLHWFVALGLLNFAGAVAYAIRIPERLAPGRFDLLGASHQIMHVLVVCGAAAWSVGVLKAMGYWEGLREAEGLHTRIMSDYYTGR